MHVNLFSFHPSSPHSRLKVLALQALNPRAPSLTRQIIRPIGDRKTIVRLNTVVITTEH